MIPIHWIKGAPDKQWECDECCNYTIKELSAPIEAIMVPIFFVLMGLQVKLESFLDWRIVVMALALLIMAVAGKVIAGLGVRNKTINRLAVGIGMMPRGVAPDSIGEVVFDCNGGVMRQ